MLEGDVIVALVAMGVAALALFGDTLIERWEKRRNIVESKRQYQMYLQNPIHYEPEH